MTWILWNLEFEVGARLLANILELQRSNKGHGSALEMIFTKLHWRKYRIFLTVAYTIMLTCTAVLLIAIFLICYLQKVIFQINKKVVVGGSFNYTSFWKYSSRKKNVVSLSMAQLTVQWFNQEQYQGDRLDSHPISTLRHEIRFLWLLPNQKLIGKLMSYKSQIIWVIWYNIICLISYESNKWLI